MKRNLEYIETLLKKAHVYDLLQINNLKRPYTYILSIKPDIFKISFHYDPGPFFQSTEITTQDMVAALVDNKMLKMLFI